MMKNWVFKRNETLKDVGKGDISELENAREIDAASGEIQKIRLVDGLDRM